MYMIFSRLHHSLFCWQLALQYFQCFINGPDYIWSDSLLQIGIKVLMRNQTLHCLLGPITEKIKTANIKKLKSFDFNITEFLGCLQ
jgi:hypothetical protein